MRAIPPPADWTTVAGNVAPKMRAALEGSFLPFWNRAIDRERGGIFTCWNNAGDQLVSRNKYTWSQGRFAYLWARLAGAVRLGLLPGDPAAYSAEAERTAAFLEQHAFLADGSCAFLLSEEGTPIERGRGSGYATSVYADCFVAMGLAETARVTGNRERLKRAQELFVRIERRIASGHFPTEPDPIPPGYSAHAIAMILLNVAWVLHEAASALGVPEAAALRAQCAAACECLALEWVQPDGRLPELRRAAGEAPDELLCRHVNPGHALEGLWIALLAAQELGRPDWIERARRGIDFAFQAGWDEEYGGLLHYADRLGGPPVGSLTGAPYERSVTQNWDKKLWWVHSEAIYALLLAYRLTGEPAMRERFQNVFDYAWRTFPQPDASIGEWIQIRDRGGAPADTVVALPVKDPYHIIRNLVLALELTGAPLSS